MATGCVESGQLKIRARRELEAEFKKWPDCEVTVLIERKHATRSLAQNRYYFGGVLRLLSEHTGYTVDELHEYFKRRFLSKPVLICDAEGVVMDEDRVGLTTTRLNKIEFGEYVESIRKVAAEMGVEIPDPDPEFFMRDKADAQPAYEQRA